MTVTLADLQIYDKGEILKINATGEIRKRFLAMGLIKGVRFKIVRIAPLGDPIEICFRGCHLSLRKQEADTIHVQKIGQVGDGTPMGRGHCCRRDGME